MNPKSHDDDLAATLQRALAQIGAPILEGRFESARQERAEIDKSAIHPEAAPRAPTRL